MKFPLLIITAPLEVALVSPRFIVKLFKSRVMNFPLFIVKADVVLTFFKTFTSACKLLLEERLLASAQAWVSKV